jgi:hypothetical protein
MAVQLQADPYLLLRGRPTLMNISAQFGVQQKALQDATMSANAPKGKGKSKGKGKGKSQPEDNKGKGKSKKGKGKVYTPEVQS